MICNGCGSAAEIAHGALNDVLQNASEKAEFKLESQNIELFGLCPQCSQDTNQDTAHLIYD